LSLSFIDLKKRFGKIKLIVSDVDGTLVDGNNKIGALTSEYVQKLHQKKILFTLASQRVHSSLVPIAKDLSIDIPYLSLNGSLIQDADGKTTLNKSIIDKKHVEKALRLADKYYVKIALCYNDYIVYTEDNSVIKDFMKRLGTTYKLVNSYDNYTDNVLEIIMSGNDRKIIKHIMSKMGSPFGFFLKVKYYRSQSYRGVYNVEIVRKGVNKKTGLKILTRHLGVSKKETMVFGDWFNDRDLFQFGGTNIALSNAVDELINMADYVTDKSNEDDGVGHFLKFFYDNLK
jgi:Cof subfamily protein (haloacid dehalogenase superfamily)